MISEPPNSNGRHGQIGPASPPNSVFNDRRRVDTQLSWKYDGKDPGEDRPGAVRVVVPP